MPYGAISPDRNRNGVGLGMSKVLDLNSGCHKGSDHIGSVWLVRVFSFSLLLSCSVAPFFPCFFGGCPTKMVFPQKGSLFFQGH